MNFQADSTISHQLVDHFFRHEYGRLLGRLVRALGQKHLEMAEDAVQAAMQQALRTWGPRGVPSDPGGWLYKVAYRIAIDNLRRSKRHQKYLEDVDFDPMEWDRNSVAGSVLDRDDAIQDDRLRMLFLCCDPAIPPESQIAMTLKLSAGFSVAEIARALLATEATIQKRITRAKEKLRHADNTVDRFTNLDWAERVPTVQHTIYLIFNEGYLSLTPDQSLRQDLCEEAMRLAILLDSTSFGSTPQNSALIALMLFHASRFNARQSNANPFISLEDQDRSQWDWSMIRKGMNWMQRSARGNVVSRYHIEASIAWEHCRSPHFDQTDWSRISELYRSMVAEQRSAYCQIGLAMAEFFTNGADAALKRLWGFFGKLDSPCETDNRDDRFSSHELAAVETLIGWIYLRTQRPKQAADSLRIAMGYSRSPIQTEAIKQLLQRCEPLKNQL